MSRRMELLCGCSPATDVCISQNFTILDSGMYSVNMINVVCTITKAGIIQLIFMMNPLLIFWLHKALVNVHE